MKLISCYIENFGGLHQYSVNFEEGLTVIEAPNGFGKTTLAEFLRAMFYGFPRASKDLQKHPRQKYLPWQGGKYGGWLLFEQDGHRYRIERSFGEKPAQDKFKLMDEDTGRESAAYTANIGEELFGIDADAFQRSTYLPQNHEGGPLSTDSIRAKLGNLLEDTGDMAGYEKALTRLQDRRKLYELQRGSGGSIYRAQQQITALQQEIRTAEAKAPELEQLRADMEQAKAEQATAALDLKTIRNDISAAARLQADKALSEQYESITAQLADIAARQSALDDHYPMGLPSETELNEAEALLEQQTLLRSSLAETQADRNAEATAAQLSPRFATSLPTDDDFAHGEALYKDLLTLQSKRSTTALQDTDAQLLTKLEAQFAPGLPDDDWFRTNEAACTQLRELKRQQADMTLSPRDAARLAELEQFFAPGIPSEDTLHTKEKQWEQAQTLKQDALHLEAALTPTAAPTAKIKTLHGAFLPALLFALLFGAAGGYLLAMSNALPGCFTTPQITALQPVLNAISANSTLVGGIALGMGALVLVLAIVLQVMQTLRNEMTRSAMAAADAMAAQQARADRLQEEARRMEQEVQDYLSRYPMGSALSPTGQLQALADRALSLAELQTEKTRLSREAAGLQQQISALTDRIAKQLQPYRLPPPADTALVTLRSRRDRYLSLLDTRKQTEQTAAQLDEQIATVQARLLALLRPYCGQVSPAACHDTLTALRRDRDAYTAAVTHLAARKDALQRRDAAVAQGAQQLSAIAARYGVALHTKSDLEDIREALRRRARLLQTAEETTERLQAFEAQHGPRPASALPESLPDMEALKSAEQTCLRRQTSCADTLATLQRREQQILDVLDTLPALRDELARVTEQKAADTHSKQLLDTTIELLTRSRESLSTRYLGGVHGYFTKYLHRLTGESAAAVRMNSDLEVQLERSGEARPLGYFSAGQADIIALCMRLALADALFEGQPCFMILDDPFVNLDDDHTARALSLLRELAADRQFVYLVCHSSRVV